MPRFRVSDHTTWRPEAEPGRLPQEPKPQTTAPKPDPVHRLDEKVRSLGALALPARVFDRMFGGFAHRRRSAFVAVQALLLILAAILVAGAVSGEAIVAYDIGEYRSVSTSGSADAYLAPGSSTRYIVHVTTNPGGGAGAIFSHAEGRITIPHLEASGPAYALELRVVQIEPGVRPRILVAAPGESPHPAPVAEDSGGAMRLEPIRFTETGTYQLVLTSKDGRGDVDLRMSLMRAPVERSETSPLTWLPMLGGGGIALIALGAVTPGARLLRQRRSLLLAQADQAYAWLSTPEPDRSAKGFARIAPFRSGVLAWSKPGREVPERLARLPGNGWVIRLD